MARGTYARTVSRRLLSVVAIASTAAAGLAAVASPSGALALQSVSFSVSTGGPAYTSTPIKADFTLANPASNTGSVLAFTIVVPPGVGTVKGAGVTGPGNWRETVLPCGSTSPCSSLVLVYATLPLTTSALKPGKSLIASITFTTPSSPTSLPFKMIGIGNGIFTTTDVPTITVIAGDAADFTITANPAATTSVAGQTQAFTLQSQNVNNVNVPYAGGEVRVELGADDPWPATLAVGGGTPVAFAPKLNPVSNATKYAVLPVLPASATGTYTLNIQFFAAGPTSIAVNDTTKTSVKGVLPWTVLAGPPASVGLDSIKDGSTTPSLPNPVKLKNLVASFHLSDQYNNPTMLQSSSVSLSAGGPGVLSAQTLVGPNLGVDPPTLGTLTTTYSQSVPPVNFQLLLTPGGALSNVVASPVDGSGTASVFQPTVAGGLTDTTNCTLSLTDPVCSSASFPNGANGQVNLVQQLCVTSTDIPLCGANPGKPVITLVQGDFTDGLGGNLYTRSSPASMTITCLVSACIDPEDGDFATDQSAEDVQEAIHAYPGHAISSAPWSGDPTPAWQTLVACQVPSGPGGNIIPSNQIFCSDHASYHLDSQGNLSFTIKYLVDPRGGP